MMGQRWKSKMISLTCTVYVLICMGNCIIKCLSLKHVEPNKWYKPVEVEVMLYILSNASCIQHKLRPNRRYSWKLSDTDVPFKLLSVQFIITIFSYSVGTFDSHWNSLSFLLEACRVSPVKSIFWVWKKEPRWTFLFLPFCLFKRISSQPHPSALETHSITLK